MKMSFTSKYILTPALRLGILLLCSFAFIALDTPPAQADLRLCNKTSNRIGVAIGYFDKREWVSEGWWNIETGACEILLNGDLEAQYYYVYALDYDRGDEWKGRVAMCTQDKEFTIRGEKDCDKRGYTKTKFFEVDTGDQQSWTVQLTDTTASKK